MQAITIKEFGGPEVLQLATVPDPVPSHEEVLVGIRATAINRADLIQRAGNYPPPPDVSQDIPGLEFAGEVIGLGDRVREWKVGDRVFGLAGGGTYAEKIVVHDRTLARIPDNLTYEQAAAIPEAFITAYDAMVTQCALSAGETILITAAGSGVGTAAVQIAKAIGATAIGTARSKEKLQQAEQLGMKVGICTDGAEADYSQAVLDATNSSGANVVLELVGGNYLARDLKCTAVKGRIIVVGLTGGARTEFDMSLLLRKRLTVRGTTLRMRPLEEKILAGQLLARHLAPLFAEGTLRPVIDRTFKLKDAAAAHEFMQNNRNFGKLILQV